MRLLLAISAAASLVVACSSSTDGGGEPVKCALGELRGTWLITYAEKDGNCGPVANETVVLTDQTAQGAGAPTCRFDAQAVSPDKCRIDLDYTCPLATGSGSQRWSGALRQVANDRLQGPMTVQVETQGQACRSTYDVTWALQ